MKGEDLEAEVVAEVEGVLAEREEGELEGCDGAGEVGEEGAVVGVGGSIGRRLGDVGNGEAGGELH